MATDGNTGDDLAVPEVRQDANASGHGMAVQAGRDAAVTIHQAAPVPVRVVWPVRVGAVPLTADCYQDRAAERRMREALTADGAAVLVPAATAVLHGLGGVGKTQIAARHSCCVWHVPSVNVTVWITATSGDAVVTGYADTARECCWRERTSSLNVRRWRCWSGWRPPPQAVRTLILWSRVRHLVR